jgi:hypothetical protein
VSVARLRPLAVVAAVLAGAAGGLLLFGSFRDPCGALLRRYAAAYDAAKPCRDDAECVLDPLAPRGPGVCDRARSARADRSRLEAVERAWAERGCPAPGESCPPADGARCRQGRCVSALK